MKGALAALSQAADACAEQLERVGDSRKDRPFVEAVRAAIDRLIEVGALRARVEALENAARKP